MRYRFLLWVGLALAVSVAAAFWAPTSWVPRARPESPLEQAAVTGSVEELRREVKLRGGAGGKDVRGFTALDWAARTGRTDRGREAVR